ncbi:MAG: SEC-C metal-binding domain-containing protein, partial [Candidatus Hydrogenedentes bacterium]|nr:SEC-C metal-binding domain-containing protein [Candidatus Hydrogenedentota bacterium]
AGMTGTAFTEAAEFNATYGLNVVQVPTNLPMNRDDRTDLIFASEEGKFRYVAREIEELHKTGRPILVGTVSIEKSERMAKILKDLGIDEFQVLNAKYHEREAAIISNAGKNGAITIATNMAGRGTDIKLAEGVRELGGLAIIGTERHESRRIDNQLRGRAGRQGDPGTTRFYVSLEDEVARLFGGDKVKRWIGMFGGDTMDEQPLDQKMVSRSIERAQRQVEEMHQETRKNVVKYDDVMNMQREVIYKLRRDVLEDRDISEQLRDMFEEIVLYAIEEYAPQDVDPEEWDVEGMIKRLKAVFGFDFSVEDQVSGDPQTMADSFLDQIEKEYERREGRMAEAIRSAYRDQIGGDETAIDFAKIARKRVHDFEMMSLLHATDSKWIDHLYSMDYLRESVRLRAMGQRDPLLEYKTDGFEMFQTLLLTIYETTIQNLFRLTDTSAHGGPAAPGRRRGPAAEADAVDDLARYQYVGAEKEQDRSFASFDTSQFNLAGQGAEAQAGNDGREGGQHPRKRPKGQPVRRAGPKIKPNEPCPCGSGKKYKKCCGART